MMQAMATHEPGNCAASGGQAPEYLECLHALARELESAMASIAANGHSSFEESVSRQLVLCSRLTSLAARHQSCRDDASLQAAPSAGDDLGIRIEDAKAKLLKLNRNYSALLNHTRRTVQMFAGLARCYSGYSHAGASASPSRTWSSEI
jgi:hypothetical protein